MNRLNHMGLGLTPVAANLRRGRRCTLPAGAAAAIFAAALLLGLLPRTGLGAAFTYYGAAGNTSGAGAALDTASFYGPTATLPSNTSDVLLNSKTTTTLTFGATAATTALSMESLDMIGNSKETSYNIGATGASPLTLTLGGNQGFTNPYSTITDDLIYVTGTNRALNLFGPDQSNGAGTLGITLASSGNFSVVGASAALTISAPISGGFNLTKTGGGVLNLNAANPFTGTYTQPNGGGTTNLGASGALGSVSKVTLSGNAIMAVSATGLTNVINSAADVTVNGTSTLNLAGGAETIGSLTSASTATSTLTIGDSGSALGGLTVGGDNTSTSFYGVIAGTHAATDPVLTKTGTGSLTLNGVNTFTGGVALNAGILQVATSTETAGTSGALGAAGTIFFNGGTLQYSATNTTDYSSRFATTASQGYNIDTSGQSVTFASPLTSSGGILTVKSSGPGGILNLTVANTYSGGTSVTSGTLQINNPTGSATGTGAVTIFNSAALQGAGFISAGNNTVLIKGTLSPGAGVGSVGTINFANAKNGGLTLNAISTLAFDINSTGSKDLVALSGSGTLTLGGGTLALTLPSTSSTGIDYTATYSLFTGVANLSLTTPNTPFGSVTGYDSTDYTPVFALNGTEYDLTFLPVPEPSTAAAISVLLLGLAGWSRRGRARAWLTA